MVDFDQYKKPLVELSRTQFTILRRQLLEELESVAGIFLPYEAEDDLSFLNEELRDTDFLARAAKLHGLVEIHEELLQKYQDLSKKIDEVNAGNREKRKINQQKSKQASRACFEWLYTNRKHLGEWVILCNDVGCPLDVVSEEDFIKLTTDDE